MVVIKQYSNTQISELNSLTGRVLYDSTLNVLRFNDSASYNNILLFKDTSNNVTGLNNVRTTGNFGINTSSADKQAEINSATGDCLRLTHNDNNGSATNYSDFLVSSTGDLTVTPSGGDITLNSSVSVSNNLSITGPILSIPTGNTAARPITPQVGYIRYNTQTSQFEGYGAGNAWGSLGGVSDVDQNTKILAEDGAGTNDNNLRFFNDGNESMRLTAGSLMGLGTTAPDKKLEINSATGDCLRLTYNDNNGSAANYVDLLVSSGGDFNITPSGNDTTFNSTMTITGATSISSTLGVTGATTLSNTTDATSSTVGGALSIAGGAGIAKKLFVGTDLAVGGNSSLTGTLGVTGATTLSSTLGVTGATTLSSTLGVTGATTLSSTLGVTGAATLSSTLGVTGVVTLSDATDATSNTAGGCLTIAGGTAIAKKLFVGGNSSLSGTLGVTGATTLSSTLGVTGATTLSSTLGVTGATLLSSTLGVTGATSLISTLSVNGAISFADTTDATSNTAGGCLTIAGGTAIAKKLFVGGNSSLTGTLGVTGVTTLSSTLGVTGATTLSSTLGVTGATTLSSTLGVTGVVSLNNTTDATSSTVGGSLTLAGGAGIAKKLFVGTDFAVGGNSSLTGTLAVTGNSVLTGSLGVGTSAPDKKVEINSSTGDCLRLTNNDSDGTAANYADMLVSSTGNLTITPSGGDVNISSHNGSSTGLKLNNVLVTSTAAELNYNDTTVGIGAANKAVILDSNRNFVNLNYVEIDELAVIKTTSANNIIVHPLSLYVVPSTAASIGLGTGIEFNSVNDTDQIYNAGYINYVSSNITTNSETGFLDFKVANSGSINSVATISNNGVLSVTSLVETSDVRSKENIQETFSNDSLEKILNVNVKTYNYIKDSEKTHRIGVIAQELKEIIPESVVISKNEDFEDFHQVQYTSLVPHLINCIKALSEEIKELKAKLN